MKEPRISEKRNNMIENMSIADKLLEDNEIWIEGEITVSQVNRIISLLHIIEQKSASENDGIINDNVRILIASAGGSIEAALNLVNYLKNTSLKVTTVAVNNCFSAAAIIWLAGEQRHILPFSRLMFHEISHVTSEDFHYDIERIKRIYDDLTKLNSEVYRVIAHAIEKDEKEVKEMIAGKDLYLSAQETLEEGFSTQIINML